MSHDLVALLSNGRTFRTLFWLGQSVTAVIAPRVDHGECCR